MDAAICSAGVNASSHGDLTDRRRLQDKDGESHIERRARDHMTRMGKGHSVRRMKCHDKGGERSQCTEVERSQDK